MIKTKNKTEGKDDRWYRRFIRAIEIKWSKAYCFGN
jgi:hypothetical protein